MAFVQKTQQHVDENVDVNHVKDLKEKGGAKDTGSLPFPWNQIIWRYRLSCV